MKRLPRRRNWWSIFSVLALLAVSAASTHSVRGQTENPLGPFTEEYAYDVELPNPVASRSGQSLVWRIELIPVTPNSEKVEGRTIYSDPEMYDSLMHDFYAKGAHVLVVIEGAVAIDASQGTGTFGAGEGTVLDAVPGDSDVNDYQYFLSNPSSECATVMRVSVIGFGQMAGLAPRPSKDVPKLSTSCGDEVVVYSGSAATLPSDTVKLAILELWSAGYRDFSAAPQMELNHDSVLVLQRGNANVELRACADCAIMQSRLFPPSSLTLQAGQTIWLDPSYPDNTRLLMLAIHSPTDDPRLYDSN